MMITSIKKRLANLELAMLPKRAPVIRVWLTDGDGMLHSDNAVISQAEFDRLPGLKIRVHPSEYESGHSPLLSNG